MESQRERRFVCASMQAHRDRSQSTNTTIGSHGAVTLFPWHAGDYCTFLLFSLRDNVRICRLYFYSISCIKGWVWFGFFSPFLLVCDYGYPHIAQRY